MRNLLNKLILFWSNKNTISQIFSAIPIFCRNLESQLKKGFLPLIGNYYLNSYLYDINDFLSNENNICFHIITPYEKKDGILLLEGYLMITAHNFLILEPADEKSKNI